MKKYILLISLMVLMSFSFSHNNLPDEKNVNFSKFINLFYEKNLPLEISEDALGEFVKARRNEKLIYTRSRYKLIEDSLLAFIPDAMPSKRVWYMAIYKIDFSKDFHSLIYAVQYQGNGSPFSGGIWLHLCTYSLSGKILDEITLGGSADDSLWQSVTVSESFAMNIHRTESFPYDYKRQTFEAYEILGDYQVSDNGKITCLQKKRRKVLYVGGQSKYDPLTPFAPVPCTKP